MIAPAVDASAQFIVEAVEWQGRHWPQVILCNLSRASANAGGREGCLSPGGAVGAVVGSSDVVYEAAIAQLSARVRSQRGVASLTAFLGHHAEFRRLGNEPGPAAPAAAEPTSGAGERAAGQPHGNVQLEITEFYFDGLDASKRGVASR